MRFCSAGPKVDRLSRKRMFCGVNVITSILWTTESSSVSEPVCEILFWFCFLMASGITSSTSSLGVLQYGNVEIILVLRHSVVFVYKKYLQGSMKRVFVRSYHSVCFA